MDNTSSKKLYRSRTDKVIAGVCGGLGEYFNMDSLIFRLIFLALMLAGGSGFWLYIILAIIIPKESLQGQVPGSVSSDSREKVRDSVHEFAADVRASAQHWAAEIKNKHPEHWQSDNRRHWFGLIIVAIGVVFLINQLFPQSPLHWEYLWPVCLIVVGVAIISRGERR